MQPQKYTAFAGAGKKPNLGFTVAETIEPNCEPAKTWPHRPEPAGDPSYKQPYWAEMAISASTPSSCATRMTPG